MGSERWSAGVHDLSSELLLKVFSLLSPPNLARTCVVCTSWNKIITSSFLWKDIHEDFQEHLLQLRCTNRATKKLSLLSGVITRAADWKAQYVEERHRASVVLGSVSITEWKGHHKRVECCRFQMEMIVTGSSDGIVRAWSSTTSKCMETFSVPNKCRVVDLEFDEEKILAVSGTEIYIWNRKRGCLLRHIHGHSQPIHSMSYADPEVLIGCCDGTIRVFDIYSGHCARIFRQHTDRVTCISVDIFASFLASGSADGTVQLCDFSTGQKLCCLLPASPPTVVVCLHLCRQSNILVGGTSRGQIHAWDLGKRKLLWSARPGPNAITSLHSAFYDAGTLLVGSINGVISVVGTERGMVLRQFVVAVATQSKQEKADKWNLSISTAQQVDVSEECSLQEVPIKSRPPVLCLRMGMTKMVTTHPDGRIRLWNFKL